MELELFSSNYSPRAGAQAFTLQFLLPELELELLGYELFHRAGAGALKLNIFIPELELRVFLLIFVEFKVKPMIYVPNEPRDTNKTV